MVKNLYIFPSHVIQIFFMSDLSSPGWKVILSYKSRSCTIIGDREQEGFRAFNVPIGMEDMLPSRANTQHLQHDDGTSMADLEVLLERMQTINTDMEADEQEDAIYTDNQYEEEYFVINNGA